MPSTLRVELQLRIVSDEDTVIRDEVILQLDKSDDRLETSNSKFAWTHREQIVSR
jgi:hypothetical protein